ncbi:hypothetical protein DMN91_002193 [Ooceraea biroi]|uniref:CCHC-type domain-containing protein n=1 Tax=Ooceraea biroi TaxID=2015173 RepID=A0A3L8DZY0_OOCBI|nr:hypothetical protein DMN91_002193 [Ooceraea biroi]
MAKCLIRGLKPEIEQRIVRNLDVQGTIADALRIERELHAMTDLRQRSNSNLSQKTPRNVSQNCQICHKEGYTANNCRKNIQYKSDLGNEILICQICRKRGHSADKYRFRDPQSRAAVHVTQEACQICSKIGHSAKSCRSNQDNSKRISVICQWCEKPGHSANNYWKKQGSGKPGTTCQLCNNYGHNAKDCRMKVPQKESTFCRYCKAQGHLLENCQFRIESNNRRNNNSQGNRNGPLVAGVQQGTEQVSRPSTSQKSN